MSLDSRPRERLLAYGGDRIASDELVALILGSGHRNRPALAVARSLLAAAGGVRALSRATPAELCAVSGIGPARAARVAAAFHLGQRAAVEAASATAAITGPDQVYERLGPRLAALEQEVFLVLALDVRGVVLAELEVARGSVSAVDVHPREVFRPLIRHGASAGVVAHNHPSGDPTPSRDDVELTARLGMAGDVIGIPLVDHVIVAREGFVSLSEHLR